MDLAVLLKKSLIVFLSCWTVVFGDCMEDLIECTRSMPDIDVILLGVEPMTKQDLTQHCTTYEDIENCIKEKLYNCKTEVWESVGKLRATFSSICYEDFDSYINHSKCLSNIPSEDKCRDQYKTEIVKATKSSKKSGWVEVFAVNGTEGSQKLCNATKDYLDCIEAAANATCGKNAAEFQHNLLRKGLIYEVDEVNCDLGYDPLEGAGEMRVLVKPGISLAAVAAIGLAIALGIAAFAVGSRYLCLKYGGDFDAEEDELLGDDTRSEAGADPGKPHSSAAAAGRPSTSRASTSSFGEATGSASAVV